LLTCGTNDNLIKVWDYHLKGNLLPAFQAFKCGEPLSAISISNDDLSLVFCYGSRSSAIYCWSFLGDLVTPGELIGRFQKEI
jgi:hypothetical protein